MNSRERILAMIEGRKTDRLPLMPIMMQFIADHTGVKYRDYSTNFRLFVESQLRVVEAFEFDYVNTMSDPAREAADCGATVEFFANSPAAFVEEKSLLADKTTFATLTIPDPHGGGRMTNSLKAIALFKERLQGDKLIEGWVEGPCAEAADLRGINRLMLDFYDDPDFVRDLFAFTIEMELRFAKEQIAAGVDLIGVGDAAASLVGPDIYREFVWPFEKKLMDGIHALGGRTRLHICGNTTAIMADIGRLSCHVVDVDFLVSMEHARQQTGPDQVLLGNLDPVRVLRNSAPDEVRAALTACHHAAGKRYIVGAGCEVTRDTPVQNVHVLREYAQTH